MKTEDLNRANQITKEIGKLNGIIDQVEKYKNKENTDGYRLGLGLIFKDSYDGSKYSSHSLDPTELPVECRDLLSDQLADDLDFVANNVLARLRRRIKELENELDLL